MTAQMINTRPVQKLAARVQPATDETRRAASLRALVATPAGAGVAQLGTTQQLPFRIGASISISNQLLFAAGGAVVGTLLLGIPGTILGGIAGYLIGGRR